MSLDPVEVRRFAEGSTAAWCNMDPDRVAAHLAPNGSLEINGGTLAVGRDAIAATARTSYEALPDMQIYLDDPVVDGLRVEYHWTFTGTNTGPGGTGNAVRVSGHEDSTLDHAGPIAASSGHVDADQYARQLAEGVSPRDVGDAGREP